MLKFLRINAVLAMFLPGIPACLFSQHYTSLLSRTTDAVERAVPDSACGFFSSVKPFLLHETIPGSMLFGNTRNASVAPVMELLMTFDPSKNNNAVNRTSAGGMIMKSDLSRNLYAEFSLWGGNYSYPGYITSLVSNNHVLPGFGLNMSRSGRMAILNKRGCLSYIPSHYFYLQLGYDKNFFGDGHRSLLLSDFASPYPFFKISTQVWKIKYINLFTAFRDAMQADAYPSSIRNKYGTFHYLCLNPGKRVSLGLFEAIIWKGTDSVLNRGYDVNYLNPVIFFRPVEYAIGSNDNALLGLNWKIKTMKKTSFYGQVILDEFLLKEMKADIKKFVFPKSSSAVTGWFGNKYGLQGGIKIFDVLGIEGWMLRIEANTVRPYVYAHGNPLQNYSHLNQPLAHPLGANFREALARTEYQKDKWFFSAGFVYAVTGQDTGNTNWGGDIFKSTKSRKQEYHNATGQGLQTILTYGELKGGYVIYPSSGIRLEGGILQRRIQTNGISEKSTFVWIGIKTGMWNEYFDF